MRGVQVSEVQMELSQCPAMTADDADHDTIYNPQIWRYRVTRTRSTRSLSWNLCK